MEKIKKIFRFPIRITKDDYISVRACNIEEALKEFDDIASKIPDMELSLDRDEAIEAYYSDPENQNRALYIDYANFYREDDNVIRETKVQIFKCDYTLYAGNTRKPEQLGIEYVGYLEVHKYDRNEAWNMCNWSAYTDTKPIRLNSYISGCSTDIIFHPQGTNIYDIPLGIGWKRVKSLSEVYDHYRDMVDKYYNNHKKEN